MTKQQIKNKISDLEQWLTDNPNHSNRTLIETDLRRLKDQLQNYKDDASNDI